MQLQHNGRAAGALEVPGGVEVHRLVGSRRHDGVPALLQRRGKCAALHKAHVVTASGKRLGEGLYGLVSASPHGKTVLVDEQLHSDIMSSESRSMSPSYTRLTGPVSVISRKPSSVCTPPTVSS